MKNLLNILTKNELFIGITLFISSLVVLFVIREQINSLNSLILAFTWLGALLIGDYLNRITHQRSIIGKRHIKIRTFYKVIVAGVVMNAISDLTGACLTRLWYYPNFNPVVYFLLLAPLGYILFGFILFSYYNLFKGNLDDSVRRGRMSNNNVKLYNFLMKLYLVLGSFVFGLTLFILFKNAYINEISLLLINTAGNGSISVMIPVLNWLGLFMIFEFICYKQGKETLTRDIIRGNFVPIFSMILASIIVILLVEVSNTPLQIWIFDKWPLSQISIANIPVIAYLLWPMQYLLLLPLIRILDDKNRENVW